MPPFFAAYLHIYPQNLRERIRKDSNICRVPVIIIGKMIKIPKVPFVKFLRGEL